MLKKQHRMQAILTGVGTSSLREYDTAEHLVIQYRYKQSTHIVQ